MRLSLPVVFLLAACGSEESATPDPTTSSVDASASSSSVSGSSSQSSSAASSGAGGSTPAGPDVESGSRIRALRLVADDGAKGPAGWFDSSLEVECTFGLASDGATRCMPRGPVWDGNTYGDQECTRPLLEVSVAAATGCSPPTYVLDDQSAAAACTGARRIAIARRYRSPTWAGTWAADAWALDTWAREAHRLDSMDLADRVRALRKEMGLTQEQLGERVGMTRTEVNHLENGRRHLKGHDVRLRFADGIGVPVALLDAFLGGNLAADALVKVATPKTPPGAAA